LLTGIGAGLLNPSRLALSTPGDPPAEVTVQSPSEAGAEGEAGSSPQKDTKKKEKSGKSKKDDDKKKKKKDKDKSKDKEKEEPFFTDIDLEDIKQLPNNRMFFGEFEKDATLIR